MQQAQSRAREAQLQMYGHNVAHKCTPDSYMRIFELVCGQYIREGQEKRQ